MTALTAIVGGLVLTPLQSIARGTVLIRGERIEAVGPEAGVPLPDGTTVINAGGMIVAPGFIDTHIHGWGGRRMRSAADVRDVAAAMARNGTTGFLPTLGGEPDFEQLLTHIRGTREAMREGTGAAEVLGIHMEGPYLSGAPTARGSQRVSAIRQPSVDELHRMVDASEGTIRKMSIAPELEGALGAIREMSRLNIVASAAHSTATYEQTMDAVAAGLRCATHTFNGMIPLHHRQPGLVGAVLTCDAISAELIADGAHVLPVVMQVLLRCKGTDRVHLVTDNTDLAGMPDGVYEQAEGRRVNKTPDKAWVEGGTLAGSVVPMNRDVRNAVTLAQCSLPDAVKMASTIPARLHGFTRKGQIAPGHDADLVIIDEHVNVHLTMVRGRQVYRAEMKQAS
jgi:N-acetylglucosamine-6-phosphate deacetylase